MSGLRQIATAGAARHRCAATSWLAARTVPAPTRNEDVAPGVPEATFAGEGAGDHRWFMPIAAAYAAPTACGGAFTLDGGPVIVDAARGNDVAVQAIADYFKTAPAGMAKSMSPGS